MPPRLLTNTPLLPQTSAGTENALGNTSCIYRILKKDIRKRPAGMKLSGARIMPVQTESCRKAKSKKNFTYFTQTQLTSFESAGNFFRKNKQ